ncbi:MAG: helix-turn-helix domain-containing protein [Rhodoferax sp.]|nr:helix-turn-helix domain-containing protein [Rhodoferax sp.]MCF8210739.1 helix-turn-helix domain-containing protein [Rhodoferax sp.]
MNADIQNVLILQPTALYTVQEAAQFFKCAESSVYQSLPGASCRPKLGRRLPEPIRFGRLIRFTGQQLIDFASPQTIQVPQYAGLASPSPKGIKGEIPVLAASRSQFTGSRTTRSKPIGRKGGAR